ncbi:hypothetical protein GGI16_002439, partial [Coemansia sp. S142-1]
MDKLSTEAVYKRNGTTGIVLRLIVNDIALGMSASVAFQEQFDKGFEVEIIGSDRDGYREFMSNGFSSNNVVLAFTLVNEECKGIEDADIQKAINRVKNNLGSACDMKYAHTEDDKMKLHARGLP